MELDKRRKRLEELTQLVDRNLAEEKSLLESIKRVERKERTRRLVEGGLLLEKGGVLDCDQEFLVGCFMKIKEIEDGSEKWMAIKKVGKKFLDE